MLIKKIQQHTVFSEEQASLESLIQSLNDWISEQPRIQVLNVETLSLWSLRVWYETEVSD